MKLVDVAEFYAERGGGVKTYIDQKLRAGAARGHEVVIVAPGPLDGEEARHGGRIVWVKGPPMPLDPKYTVLWRERRVHAILDHERPDLVEGSSPWTGGWFAARWRGPAPRALVFHSDPVATYPHTFLDRWVAPPTIDRAFGWYWRYLRALSRRFDATVVAGAWLAERLERLGVRRPVTVPFGVERAELDAARPDPALRRELLVACGLGEDASLLVAAGRLNPEKRWGSVLRATAEAGRRRPLGLVLLGDGPLHGRLERLAAELPHIHLAGRVPRGRLTAILASADALVHGCAAETFGLVVAEALSAGLPVVVPDRGGAVELVDPSCAETFTPSDVAGCAAAILRLLDRDPEALHEAARRAAAARVHDPEAHFDALFSLYGDMVARGHRG